MVLNVLNRLLEGFLKAQRCKMHHITEIYFAIQRIRLWRIGSPHFRSQSFVISNRAVMGKQDAFMGKRMGMVRGGSLSPS